MDILNIVDKIKNKSKNIDNTHYLYNANCIDILKQIPDNSIKLILTDPPYNIKLKYNSYNDNQNLNDYYDFLKIVSTEFKRILTDDWSLYLINYPEMNARMLPFLEDTLWFHFKRWLTWHYPTNIWHSKNNFTRSQRSILFLSKTKDNFFNKPVQPYKNPNVWKVKKLIDQWKKGRWSYDSLETNDLIEILWKKEVERDFNNDFLCFNLLKNVSKDRAWDENIKHPCQLPLSLLKVFINASSEEWDIVLDAFAGTFTTSKASKDLNRKSIWIELDEEYLNLWFNRLKNE